MSQKSDDDILNQDDPNFVFQLMILDNVMPYIPVPISEQTWYKKEVEDEKDKPRIIPFRSTFEGSALEELD